MAVVARLRVTARADVETLAAAGGITPEALPLSRRSGSVHRMTCAIPGAKLAEVVERLKSTCGADKAVAAYAAEDARRFGIAPR